MRPDRALLSQHQNFFPPSYSLFDLESLHPDNPAAPAQGTSNFPNAQSVQYCPLASLISVIET